MVIKVATKVIDTDVAFDVVVGGRRKEGRERGKSFVESVHEVQEVVVIKVATKVVDADVAVDDVVGGWRKEGRERE